MRPLSVSTSTMVRTKRPQWQPLAWRNGASSGTVTVIARISTIFIFGFMIQQFPNWAGIQGGCGLKLTVPGDGAREGGLRLKTRRQRWDSESCAWTGIGTDPGHI